MPPSGDGGGAESSTSPAALMAAAEDLAANRLWPESTAVDRAPVIPPSHFEALANHGLFGLAAPTSLGGSGVEAATVRAVLRALASGCGATAFAFAQHHGTVGLLASSSNESLRHRYLPSLVSEALAGIAFAHVRRAGSRAIAADAVAGGWRLSGKAPWVTSWGSATVLAVAAVDEKDRIVWSLVPAVAGDGLSSGGAFDLMVYQATQTVALVFDDYHVPQDQVLAVVDGATWRERDRLLAARPNPLCLGVGDRALSLLSEVDVAAADGVRSWWENVARSAEGQCQAVDENRADLSEVAAVRARTIEATQQLTTMLIAAIGGMAVEGRNPAQRLAREALFYVIQAQNSDGRSATIERLSGTMS